MAEALVASDLAYSIIYQPADRNDVELRALPVSRDQEGQAGSFRSRQDSVVLKIRVADLEEPRREDRFQVDDLTYSVSADPQTDELGEFWVIGGYRLS